MCQVFCLEQRTWGVKKREKVRLNVIEVKCVMGMRGVTIIDRQIYEPIELLLQNLASYSPHLTVALFEIAPRFCISLSFTGTISVVVRMSFIIVSLVL